jgi:DNA-binding transcriptional LysR family regulator
MLDPRRLLTFRQVAELGSFSRAAEALSLSQPAVSQQVAALERQVGGALLVRGAGGLALTDAGQALLGHAAAVADRLALADRQVAELLAGEQRELRIGAFPSALATLVPAALARVGGEARVTVQEGASSELAGLVASGALHLAITFRAAGEPPPDPGGVEVVDLLDEPFVVALGPSHPLAGRSSVRLAALRDDPWTAPSRQGLIHAACAQAGFEPRIAYLTRDPLAIRALLLAGLAVTLTSRLLAGELAGVAAVAVAGDAPRRIVSAVVPERGVSPLASALLDALRRP